MIFLPIALLLVFPVHATPPTHLTGTIKILTSVVTVTRTADGNTFYSQAFTGSIAGGIEGNIVGTRFVIVHPTGNFTASGESTFTGTVNGNDPAPRVSISRHRESSFQMGKSAGARLRSGTELVDSQVFTERGPNSLVPAPLPIRCSYTSTQLRECEQGRISPFLGILFLPLTPGSFGTTLSSK